MAAGEGKQDMTEQTKLRLDEFVAKAVPDPKNPGEAQLLSGFLGASSESEHTRIYWDVSLATYIDVKTADIVHSEPLPTEQSPLGGSYIWLKRDAHVSSGSAGGQTAKGKFFEGPLMAAYGAQFGAAAGAGSAPLAGGGAPWPYSYQVCAHSVLCPPHTLALCRTTPNCFFASPGCPPVGQGTPAQGQGAETPAAAPQAVNTYPPLCGYSYVWCGGAHNTHQNCFMLEPGTVRGGCGGCTRPDPDIQEQAQAIRVTVVQPWCPYPSEICTHLVACHHPFAAPALRVTIVQPGCPYPSEICTHFVACRRPFAAEAPAGNNTYQWACLHVTQRCWW